LVPSARSVAILVNPKRPDADIQSAQLREAAQTLNLQFHTLKASSERDFDAAFQAVVQLQVSALVVAPDALFSDRRDQIVAIERSLLQCMIRFWHKADIARLSSNVH
jgi:ABC-type uncharacterized transport system substrate-binding protein